ncbi:MAG TPA: hypothetical protein VF960_04255 [Chloroflexota bacterium]
MSLFVSLLGLIAWSVWGYTVVYLDPDVSLAAVAFYGALFVALTCTLARLRERPRYEAADGTFVPARPALGHGASIAILVLFALWLQSLRMLTSLNVILLVSALGFVELGFVLTRDHPGAARPRRSRRQGSVTASAEK